MSVGATPSLDFIGNTVGDTPPHKMSEMYGIRFASGNSPTSGTIRLSDFRNKVISPVWLERTKMLAADKESADRFGASVAISADGNTAIMGAPGEDTGANNKGSAYIFIRSGSSWSQQAKIQATDTSFQFGSNSVALSADGNTAIIGVPSSSAPNGAAYIFVRSGTNWSQQQKIQAAKTTTDLFGLSVSLSNDGNTAIIGAPYDDTGGARVGAAYIFNRSGTSWSQTTKLQGSNKAANDQFGWGASISGDGNTAIVGANYKTLGEGFAGAAYIFVRSGTDWSEQSTFQATDRGYGDYFGSSVSISTDGNTAIIGAPYEDTGDNNAGAAYIFVRSGTNWSQQQKIQAPSVTYGGQFGDSVSISGDSNTVIVGEPGSGTPSAHVFIRSGTTWSWVTNLKSANPTPVYDNMGRSVSISNNGWFAISGAPSDNTGGATAGAAYAFQYAYYV